MISKIEKQKIFEFYTDFEKINKLVENLFEYKKKHRKQLES